METLCACGCGKVLHGGGTRHYFPGHKPKSIPSTPEQILARRSEGVRRRWERWHAEHPKDPLKPCACGCGTMVKYKWAHGHHVRINNPSKLESVKELRRQNLPKRRAAGLLTRVSWKKGLTKDTDPRVAAAGRACSATLQANPQELMARAERMAKRWDEGKLAPLRGPDHPMWKGGTSHISQRLRASRDLYKLWKLPLLQRDGFRCQECQRGSDEAELQVHHDQERFADILRQTIFQLFPDALERQLSFEEGTQVIEEVVAYHVWEHVSGRTLCVECHDQKHAKPPSAAT